MSTEMQALFDEIEKLAEDTADRKDYVVIPASMVRQIVNYILDRDKYPLDIRQLRPDGAWYHSDPKLGSMHMLGYVLIGVIVFLLVDAMNVGDDLPLPMRMARPLIDALSWPETADNAFTWIDAEATHR